jgi:hypothetical protein
VVEKGQARSFIAPQKKQTCRRTSASAGSYEKREKSIISLVQKLGNYEIGNSHGVDIQAIQIS